MAKKREALDDQVRERIARALEDLEYGSIHIVVHDSQVVQIERTEKYRLPPEKAESKNVSVRASK
ncbi:YezD family protein [Brevibacillus choshinensis]|uniref:YezD family protein n=1 Tax=Brevibacillus choshinensis TaxID=54911 RepID=A0ABX7FMV4_BRECH|nr:YezD family protein [Brevibacillus choshinensis]QRG66621.1 YezD family protein [Brevibacillus choshinensis]